MNSPQDLKKAIKNLKIPDASEYDFLTEEGVAVYRAAWKEYEIYTDDLVKDLVRSNTLGAFGAQAKFADKAIKHLEKWRLHAQATTDLWNRTWEWKAKKETPDAYDSFLSWLGVKGTRKQWIATEEKALARIVERLGKSDAKLFREYELLVVEFDARIPN